MVNTERLNYSSLVYFFFVCLSLCYRCWLLVCVFGFILYLHFFFLFSFNLKFVDGCLFTSSMCKYFTLSSKQTTCLIHLYLLRRILCYVHTIHFLLFVVIVVCVFFPFSLDRLHLDSDLKERPSFIVSIFGFCLYSFFFRFYQFVPFAMLWCSDG